MTIHDKLRLYLSDRPVTWTPDGAAVWVEEGPRMLVCVEGAPSAAAIVDLRLRASAANARLTVAHEGAPSPVAQRAAQRFGIELLDATHLPEPEPVVVHPSAVEVVVTCEPPAVEAPLLAPAVLEPPVVDAPVVDTLTPEPLAVEAPALEAPLLLEAPPAPVALLVAHVEPARVEPAPEQPFPLPAPGFFRALERPAREPVAFALPGPAFFRALERVEDFAPALEADALAFLDVALPEEAFRLPEPPAAPAAVEPVQTDISLPALLEAGIVVAGLAPEMPAPALATPEPAVAAAAETDSELIVATSLPEPTLAGPASAPAAPDVEPALPATWWQKADVELVPAVRVTQEELAAMPWHEEADYELAHTPVRRTPMGDHPTLRPLDARAWGLPWPRTTPPADGVALNDPRIWGAPERIHAMREDLDKVGAPSFGAVKPEPHNSQWLKRLSQFGGP